MRQTFRQALYTLGFATGFILLSASAAAQNATPPAAIAPQTAAPHFKLVFIGAQSGPSGIIGKFAAAGYQGAVDDVNAHGGILGRQVDLVLEDTQSLANNAVSILQEDLNSGRRPDAVIAGQTSNETLALLPLMSQNKLISMTHAATPLQNNPALYPYHFTSTLYVPHLSIFMADYLKKRGFKKIAILSSNEGYGQTIGKAHQEAFEKAGLQVVSESYALSDVDLTARLQRLAGTKPDAFVFMALLPTSAALILEARARVGLGVPTFADASLSADLARLTRPEQQKNVFLTEPKVNVYVPPEQRTALFSTFLGSLKKYENGQVDGVAWTASIPWDGIQVLALAYNQAGTTDPDKVKAALEALRMPPERERRFLTFPSFRYSATDHFNIDEDASAFTVIPLGPRIDGTFKPGT